MLVTLGLLGLIAYVMFGGKTGASGLGGNPFVSGFNISVLLSLKFYIICLNKVSFAFGDQMSINLVIYIARRFLVFWLA